MVLRFNPGSESPHSRGELPPSYVRSKQVFAGKPDLHPTGKALSPPMGSFPVIVRAELLPHSACSLPGAIPNAVSPALFPPRPRTP